MECLSSRREREAPWGRARENRKFIQASSPEIWSETISGGEQVLAGKWGGLFWATSLEKIFGGVIAIISFRQEDGCSSLPCRGVLSFRLEARETLAIETPRIHHAGRRHGGRMAARGARAAGRADATHRRADGSCRRSGGTGASDSAEAGASRIRMDRRSQHPNRDTLWWGRRGSHTGARSRTRGARARRTRWPNDARRPGTAASDKLHSHHYGGGQRARRARLRFELGTSGREHHWLHFHQFPNGGEVAGDA